MDLSHHRSIFCCLFLAGPGGWRVVVADAPDRQCWAKAGRRAVLGGGRRGLGARIPATPCSSISFAPSLRGFSVRGRRGLGARIPAKPCSSVPFAPSLRAFSTPGRRGLGARTPAKPCSSVPFTPSLRAFSAPGRRGLGAQTPAKPCSFVPLAPSLQAFSTPGRRLESRKGEWPRPFSFSSFSELF